VVSFSSPDVLRFMGKKVTRLGNAAGGLKLPLGSDLKIRSNGARVKHRLGPNSIKLYDKAFDELGPRGAPKSRDPILLCLSPHLRPPLHVGLATATPNHCRHASPRPSL
jgi:hypothetical protein